MGSLLFIFFLSLCGLLSLVHRGNSADVCLGDSAGLELRILPLGASITWGLRSTDGNGYRKALRDQLRWKGFEVNMVGSRANGTMVDNVRVPVSENPQSHSILSVHHSLP
jgi:hypothetical protein